MKMFVGVSPRDNDLNEKTLYRPPARIMPKILDGSTLL